MRIFLIRHGSTAGNLERRYVGSTDEPLTDEAVRQLEQKRQMLCPPQRLYVSPMKRCVQTAALLFPGAEPILVPDLRECGFGAFEYKNYEELKDDARYQAWIDSGGTLAFPDGESRETFIRRCASAFQDVCMDALQQNVSSTAFVVHGGTIMAVLDRLSEPHRDYFDWQVKNAGGFVGTVEMDAAGKLRITELRPLAEAIVYPEKESTMSTEPDAYFAEPEVHSDLPVLTGIEDQFVIRQNKKLRCGYTTGSCAAAAAQAAAGMLLSGKICSQADLMTPKGILLHLPVVNQKIEAHTASCAVRKFAGDDPDATDGILIYAKAEYLGNVRESTHFEQATEQPEVSGTSAGGQAESGSTEKTESGENRHPQIQIEGGIGVGRVTKPGLEQPVGAPAINRVPREMITREVTRVCEQHGYTGGIRITISVPEGTEIAKKTFNPHIGILGGISILGTSGIVVPMSEEALIASIRLEMQQKYANGERYLLITPGNYGADFIRRQELSQHLDVEYSMKCSNYVGETVDMAVEMGFQGILFISHIGKFIKVSGGIMNTHSAHADCRAELMAAQTLRAGLAQPNVEPSLVYETVNRLLETNTTEEAVAILRETNLLEAAMEEITKRIKFHLQKRCRGEIQTEVILFSNQSGYLGESDGAEQLLGILAGQ